MNKFKKIICILISCVLILTAFTGCKKEPKSSVYDLNDYDFTISQLAGVDELGRTVGQTICNKEHKFSGIYYFVWLGYWDKKIYDISKLLEEYENGTVRNLENPLWAIEGEFYNAEISPNGKFHYWNEPLYGYYNSEDPWVVRKHLEMLSYAQIDYLMLDFTNGDYTYDSCTYALLDGIAAMLAEGFDVPKVAFMLPGTDENVVGMNKSLKRIYEQWISNEKYEGCFFVADEFLNPSGKPFVTLGTKFVSPENEYLLDYIWAKPLYWPNETYEDDYFPSCDYEMIQKNWDGYMAASTGVQTTWCSDAYAYPDKVNTRGRGWSMDDYFGIGNDPEKVLQGTCFDYQWDNVYNCEEEVYVVHLSCWNEFVAQKQSAVRSAIHGNAKHAVFVDTFDEANSRDIEPVKGRLGDNYYNQLVQKLRQFKQTEASTAVKHGKNTININNGFVEWADIKGNYLDPIGDTIERNYVSADPALVYTDKTNRNDIARLKFANDNENLYVLVETANDITPYVQGDTNWMNLYISTGETGGFTGFNYVINRSPDGLNTSVEKITGDTVSNVGNAKYVVNGNRIFFEIPLSVLGVSSTKQLSIKATDNIQKFLDADDFYISGDSAPIGRLSYAYYVA